MSEVNKSDWLPVVVHKFKPSGKWYSEEELLIPNTLDIYDRRKYLDGKLVDGYFSYVSLDSNILGFPFMKPSKEENK